MGGPDMPLPRCFYLKHQKGCFRLVQIRFVQLSSPADGPHLLKMRCAFDLPLLLWRAQGVRLAQPQNSLFCRSMSLR